MLAGSVRLTTSHRPEKLAEPCAVSVYVPDWYLQRRRRQRAAIVRRRAAAHVGSVPRRTRDGSGASLLGVARQPKLDSMVPSEVSPTKASAAVPPALMRLVDRNPTELEEVIDER